MEKQVILRSLPGTGNHWADGGGGRAAQHGVSSCHKQGCICSHNNNRIVRRNERWRRTDAWLQGDVRCSFFFFKKKKEKVSSLRPSVAETQETRLPRCQHLTTDVFFCPRVWARQNAKSIRPFLPHFLFDATSKSQWTVLQRPQRGEKKGANGTKQAQNESTGEKTSPYTVKTPLTSEPQVTKPMRQAARGWTNISFYY